MSDCCCCPSYFLYYSRPSKLFHKSSSAFCSIMSSLPLSRRPHPNGPATFFYSVDILVCRAFFPNPVSTLKMKRIPLAFHQKIGPEYIFFLFLTVRVISHGPISLKIVLVVVVVVVEDTLLKFQYIMNNSTIL